VRVVELLTSAAQAERLLITLEARRRMRAALCYGVASLFGAAVLILAHIGIWDWLVPMAGQPVTALILIGTDLAGAVALVVAAQAGQQAMINEARTLRDTSLRAIWEFDTLFDLLGLSGHSGRGGALAVLLTQMLARRGR
jgi:hypothetical protein